MTDALPVMLGAVSEKQFQAQVVGLARLLGWKVYHPWMSLRSPEGFPDLVLVRPSSNRVLFVELKSERGRLTEAQQEWLMALNAAQGPNLRVCVWRPSDWDELERALR